MAYVIYEVVMYETGTRLLNPGSNFEQDQTIPRLLVPNLYY